jgi:hypothetical protein
MFGFGKSKSPAVLNLPAAGNGRKSRKVGKIKVVQRESGGRVQGVIQGKHRR